MREPDSDPSTDASRSSWSMRLRNFLASAFVVAAASVVYALLPFNQAQIERKFGSPEFFVFSGRQFLFAAALAYITALAGFYLFVPTEQASSKSLRCLQLLLTWLRAPTAIWRQGLDAEGGLALRVTLLKFFFAPLMGMSLMIFCTSAWTNGAAIAGSIKVSGSIGDLVQLFNRFGFWFLIQAILFVDTLIFTAGYLLETRRLGNQIRSVDPSLLGWAATMICYPPFNQITLAILGSHISEFPHFEPPWLHLLLNLLLLALMAMYMASSVALGLKASNLTHRGIVCRGPYRLVRHPAYACKNMAWWIAAVPLVTQAFGHSAQQGIQAMASVAGWSLIYVLRALTEEDHLRGVDGSYARYCQKVPYRFIPGLI